MLLPLAIGAALLAGGTIGKLLNRPPEFSFDSKDIDKMISAFRSEGLQGIQALGAQQQQGATARLAASGQELTPAARQAAFTPILENLSRARAELGSKLAQISGSLNFDMANKEYQSDLLRFQQLDDMFNAISDIGGLGLTNGLGGGKMFSFGTGGTASAFGGSGTVSF